MKAPIVLPHDGVQVVRDDLFPGGTKARFMPLLFDGADEAVYASPAEGGAQTALATVAKQLGKRATLFVAGRASLHPRTIEAANIGAKIVTVRPGYLNVVQARAQEYCRATGARLVPFGVDMPQAIETIAQAARATGLEPDEVWCAAGSGVLARSLAKAWPNARRHVVQVGRKLDASDVAGAKIHIAPQPFAQPTFHLAPFPSCPHYDAKAWHIMQQRKGKGLVVFWNVTREARVI